jgi:tetratricopeptide (TPR) repeat protein/transcriptional regulator with XRE-family HTH domain
VAPAAFGILLRQHRIEAELTQEQLAERARLSARVVSDLERGVRHTPRGHTVWQLADALELSEEDRATFEAMAQSGLSGLLSSDGADGHPVTVIPRYPLSTTIPLVGREYELEAIRATLALPSVSGPRLVLIAAEAGMGKTRLLAEVALLARQEGMLTLAGGCYDQEGHLPYGPIHDALLDYVRVQPESLLCTRFDGLLGGLVRIVPEMTERVGEVIEVWSGEAESQRLRLFLAVSRALQRITQDHPLVLLFDDLHWADEVTLHLLHFLLRQPDLVRVCMLGAYRGEELFPDTPLAQLAAAPDDDGRVRRIQMEPLPEPELTALLEERLAGRCGINLAAMLHQRTSGNPFFALQMLRLLRQEGQIEPREDGWQLVAEATIGLPEAVRGTIERRLRLLQPEAYDVLALGAVLGREFEYPALEALSETDERTLLAALEEAEAAHLLSETDDQYSFQHPMLHEVIYQRMPGLRRIGLHGRAGFALERLYGAGACDHAVELAHHFTLARQPERALHYSLLAGDQAESVFAHAEAERYYRTAGAFAEELENQVREAEALEKLGAVVALTTRFDEALETLEHAARMYHAQGDGQGEGRAAAQLGWVHLLQGSTLEGIARIQPVLTLLEGDSTDIVPSHGLAALYVSLLNLLDASNRYAEQLLVAERAVRVAEAIDDEAILAEAQMFRAFALLGLGRVEEGLQVLEELIPLVELVQGVGSAARLGRVLGVAAHFCLVGGELDKSRHYARRGLEVMERVGMTIGIGHMTLELGKNAYYAGNWDEARNHFERVLDILRPLGMTLLSAAPLGELGALRLWQGDLDQASRYLEDCLAVGESIGNAGAVIRAQSLLAERDVLQRQPRVALARLEPLLDRLGEEDQERTALLPILAWTLLELGHAVQAEELVTEAVARATSQHHRLALVEAQRVQGMVATRCENWEDAERIFGCALHLARSMGYPYGRARVLYEHGLVRTQKGDRNGARKQLEEALAIFQHLGALLYAEQAEQALRGLDSW